MNEEKAAEIILRDGLIRHSAKCSETIRLTDVSRPINPLRTSSHNVHCFE